MATDEQYPSMVMILRHGEKPGNPDDDKDGGPNLSILGSARAAALPYMFTPDPSAPPVQNLQQIACGLATDNSAQFSGRYGNSSGKVTAGASRFLVPDFLFATQQDQPGTGSNRPAETITPLAQALQFLTGESGLAINQNFQNTPDGINSLVQEIEQHGGTYGGKVVLICWHHGTIPELTEAFGVPSSQLPAWPKGKRAQRMLGEVFAGVRQKAFGPIIGG